MHERGWFARQLAEVRASATLADRLEDAANAIDSRFHVASHADLMREAAAALRAPVAEQGAETQCCPTCGHGWDLHGSTFGCTYTDGDRECNCPEPLPAAKPPLSPLPRLAAPTQREQALREAVSDFLAAEEAVDREAERAAQPGAHAWSSGPVVRRINAVARLRALAATPSREGV